MKKHIFLLFFCAIASAISAQSMGKWTVYAAYHNATCNIPVGDEVYALCDGALFAYHPADGEVRTFSKADALSDCGITHIGYSKAQKSLLIIYADANVDVLHADGSVTNMMEFKDKTLADKTVNGLCMEGSYAYVATNFGIVVINMAKEEFAQTYEFGKAVRAVAVSGGTIYAATADGLYAGSLSANLLDRSNWTLQSGSFAPTQMVFFDGSLYGLSGGLNRLNISTMSVESLAADNFTYLNATNGVMVAGCPTRTLIYTSGSNFTDVRTANNFNYLAYGDGTYWAANNYDGLQPYKLNTAAATLEAQTSGIIPNSPIRNHFSYMTYTPSNRLLVAGGSHNYSRLVYPGTLMSYENNTWTNFDETGIAAATGFAYENLTSIAQDPNDAAHHFASSFGHGIYEFQDGKFVKNYTCTNSSLATILPTDPFPYNYVRVNGLTYDKAGNLWMLNNEVDTVLKIYRADKTWQRVYLKALKGNPTMDQILFDKHGRVWINSRRTAGSVSSAGVFFLNYGGSLSAIGSDAAYYRTTFINQDNTNYSFNQVYCLAEDLDGYIWVGTNLGPFCIDNASQFASNGTVKQVKIPRNDGSNYADYLLSGVPITAIATDGGNRKWFGTDGSGIYLVSADGQETLHHFTTENSPLLSNVINSIAINGSTGEVMIGTQLGLVSYMSDATDAADDLSKDDIHAYPNPVKSDYEGVITVVGLTYDSEVKITSTTGQLIATGTSVGGTFTWNGRNQSGKRVASGVYNVIANTADGSKGVVTKIVMIK